jgi:hypothetical protein
MPRRSDSLGDPSAGPHELTAEEWQAQVPCPECGGRPGRDPTSGMQLRIKLPNGEWEEGHTYQCQKRRQE